MTRSQALEILGLQSGATNEEIRTAHRSLLKANHPDRGGRHGLLLKSTALRIYFYPKAEGPIIFGCLHLSIGRGTKRALFVHCTKTQ